MQMHVHLQVCIDTIVLCTLYTLYTYAIAVYAYTCLWSWSKILAHWLLCLQNDRNKGTAFQGHKGAIHHRLNASSSLVVEQYPNHAVVLFGGDKLNPKKTMTIYDYNIKLKTQKTGNKIQ